MRRARRTLAPYFTVAREASTCRETGACIGKGDRVAYFPDTRRAYAEHSRYADQIRALEFASAYAMPDAHY